MPKQRKIKSHQPSIYFDDQVIYLRASGMITANPGYSRCNIATIPFDEFDPARSYADRRQFQGRLVKALKYSRETAEDRATILQQYLNGTVAPKAKILWLLADIIKDGVFEITRSDGVVSINPPDEIEAIKKGMFNNLALMLFSTNTVVEFVDFVKSRSSTDLTAATLIKRLDLPEPAELRLFVGQEIKLELEKLGFSGIAVTGDGSQAFSDGDKVQMIAAIKKGAKARIENISGLIAEAREHVKRHGGQFKISPENEALSDYLLKAPKRANPDIAVLFDLGLQSEKLIVIFYGKNAAGKVVAEYGQYMNSIAVYIPTRNKVILPKNDFTPCELTVSQALGRLQGCFTTINDMVVAKIDEPRTKESIWNEEILHRGFDVISEFGFIPFKPDSKEMREFSLCLTKDLPNLDVDELRKSSSIKIFMETNNLKNIAELVPHVTIGNPKFNANIFNVVAAESLASVCLAVNQGGWEKAGSTAPNIVSNIRDVILPLAYAKAKTSGIKLTHPEAMANRWQNMTRPVIPETNGISAIRLPGK